MPDQKVYFGQIENVLPLRDMLQAGAAETATVQLGSQRAQLDMRQPVAAVWAKMIDLLQSENKPAYIELDAATNVITQLYMPVATNVLGTWTAENGDVQVALTGSQAIHHLRSDLSSFRQFADMLREAKDNGTKVMVTATHPGFEIIDVRPLPPGAGEEKAAVAEPEPAEPDRPVTPERAAELFKLITADTCTPCGSVSPCIPFNFPYGGCWVRAHLMCFRLDRWGATPGKVWISGNPLQVDSRNAWECKPVGWGWHVAATLPVIQPEGDPVPLVFDPSICNEPVTIKHWRSLMGSNSKDPWLREWQYYNYPGVGGASEEEANTEMQSFRLGLDADCAKHGPPPYCK